MRKNVNDGSRTAAPLGTFPGAAKPAASPGSGKYVLGPAQRREKLLDGGHVVVIRPNSRVDVREVPRRSVLRQFIFDEAGSVVPVAEPVEFQTSLKTSLLRRIGKLIETSLGRMNLDEMMKAVEAATPADTLARVLSAAPDVGVAESAWTRALLRGAAAKQRMLERAGGSLTSSQAAKLLGVSVQAVKQRIERRAILAVPLAGGAWGFPAVQFGPDGRVRTGVAQVVRAAEGISPWVLLSILCDPAGDAPRPTLLEALDDPAARNGVLARIATYGQHLAA